MGILSGQVAIVTGSGQGIGKAIAMALAREGAAVVLAERDRGSGLRVEKALKNQGFLARFIPTDVTREASVGTMVSRALKAFGRVDILVNNAAILKKSPVDQTSLHDWQSVLTVNLTGPFLCIREALPHLKDGRRGCIVNIASALGKHGAADLSAYSASKAGVISLTQSVAEEAAGYGVRVYAVCPSLVKTAMARPFLRGRAPSTVLSPEDVARTVLNLTARRNDVANGQAIDVSPCHR